MLAELTSLAEALRGPAHSQVQASLRVAAEEGWLPPEARPSEVPARDVAFLQQRLVLRQLEEREQEEEEEGRGSGGGGARVAAAGGEGRPWRAPSVQLGLTLPEALQVRWWARLLHRWARPGSTQHSVRSLPSWRRNAGRLEGV